ncbi:MAG: chloride channel protein [Silvibacterium sp.]|nr:chloride channel protein [Silvibacterium sp.]
MAERERLRSDLGDFNPDPRMIVLSALALVVGIAGAALAYLLLHLIYAATNLFYFHRFGWQFVSPGKNELHWLAVLVPVVGGLIIGLMARFGSEKIRGHGMPEAIEAILVNGAKVDARVAFFKPVSAAIAIGSGGPFGAEGPIIMTAGSVGSLFAQLFHLSDAERTTLLVAGAAAGMAGVFSTPLAAILLAVELLLFEWRPRSLVPVAVAATTAGALRRFFLGPGPLFPMQGMAGDVSPRAVLAAFAVGVVGGALALVLSRAVYASEDLFENHLPIHWMWWPAVGGVVIGVGGLIFPRALGTGYDVIASLIGGDHTWELILGVLIVKSIIWSFSLGSGTSGGILAPLLMIGGALGALLSPGLPGLETGAWPLIGMAAVLSGAIGCPLTATALAMELTHNYTLILPLLMASVAAHAFTVLLQRRSILTERLSRRGYHLSREYSVDPLETMTVSQVMRAGASATIAEPQRITSISVAYPGETLRTVAERMAAAKLFEVAVVDPETQEQLGAIRLGDMLHARALAWQRETLRQRVRRFPFLSAAEPGSAESAV